MGCVFAYVIVLALIGPERLGRKFGVAHDNDMVDAAGQDAVSAVVRRREAIGHDDLEGGSSDGDEKRGVKGTVMAS